MKKRKENTSKKFRFIAFAILALVAAMAFLTDWQVATGITMAMSLVIGNITLNDEEEKMYNALNEGVKKEIEKFTKGYITETDMLNAITKQINDSKFDLTKDAEYIKLKEALENQGLTIKTLTESGKGNKVKTTAEQMKEQIEANKEAWEIFKSGKGPKYFEFNVSKTAGNMYISTNTGSPAWSGVPQFEPGLVDVMRQQPLFIPSTNFAQTSSATISYVQKVNVDGNATLVNDTTIAPLVDFDIAVATSNAVDYTDSIKIHANMLDDIDFMAGEIDKELRYKVDIVADNGVLADTISNSAAFSLTTIAVITPNIFDCIMAAATQIESGFGMANEAWLNPVDYANMIMSKDSDGGYVMPPFITANGTTVAGLTVKKSAQITAGNLLVFDTKKAYVRELQGFTATAGWENDDFRKRLVTFLGVRRLHKYFKSNEAGAFVYDQIADIKTAITLT